MDFNLGYKYPRGYAKTFWGVSENILRYYETQETRLNLEPVLMLALTKIRTRIEVFNNIFLICYKYLFKNIFMTLFNTLFWI
jgi:hypothetical protein